MSRLGTFQSTGFSKSSIRYLYKVWRDRLMTADVHFKTGIVRHCTWTARRRVCVSVIQQDSNPSRWHLFVVLLRSDDMGYIGKTKRHNTVPVSTWMVLVLTRDTTRTRTGRLTDSLRTHTGWLTDSPAHTTITHRPQSYSENVPLILRNDLLYEIRHTHTHTHTRTHTYTYTHTRR